MAYVATASDPPIGGFTTPLKLPVTKEKNRFVWLPMPKLFFWISPWRYIDFQHCMEIKHMPLYLEGIELPEC